MDRRLRWALLCSGALTGFNILLFYILSPPDSLQGRRPAVARLASVHGRIDIRDPALRIWNRSTDGTPIVNGSLVRSSPNGRARLVFTEGGDTILLEPDSSVLIEVRRGQNLIEVQSGAVRVDQPVQNLSEIKNGRTVRVTEARVDHTPNQSGTSPNTNVKFLWGKPDRDLSHEAVDQMSPLDLSWEPLNSGHIEIWTGPHPEELRLRQKLSAQSGRSTHTPVVGRSFLQARWLSEDAPTQFGPLIEITARLTRSFRVMEPNVLSSLVQTDQKPVAIRFAWEAPPSSSGFELTLNSRQLKGPIKRVLSSAVRDTLIELAEPGQYDWSLKLTDSERPRQALIESGRIEIARQLSQLLTLERTEPASNQLTVFGPDSEVKLAWRSAKPQSRLSEKATPPEDGKVYQVELRSRSTGEIRKFSTEKTDLVVTRVEKGMLSVRIQGFNSDGLEVTKPLQFDLNVLEGARPRWPASAAEPLQITEVRSGTYRVEWPQLGEPSSFRLIITKNGSTLREQEVQGRLTVLEKLQPGRYRVEVRARTIKSGLELEPLNGSFTVSAESSVPAPQIRRIEVKK